MATRDEAENFYQVLIDLLEDYEYHHGNGVLRNHIENIANRYSQMFPAGYDYIPVDPPEFISPGTIIQELIGEVSGGIHPPHLERVRQQVRNNRPRRSIDAYYDLAERFCYPEITQCPCCGNTMLVKRNRTTNTEFLGCANYPRCKATRTTEGYIVFSKYVKDFLDHRIEEVQRQEERNNREPNRFSNLEE